MTQYVQIALPDGTQALFESADEKLVLDHAGEATVNELGNAVESLRDIADSANHLCQTVRSQIKPDEISVEIGVGLSGEVGWFFAKSSIEGAIKLTLTWNSDRTE